MAAERNHEIDVTASVAEQASAWWVLLNEGNPTEADQRAFAEWTTRSPERVSAYLHAVEVAQVFRDSRTPWPDTPVDELIRSATASPVERLRAPRDDVGVESDASAAAPRTWRFGPHLAIAGLFAAAIVAVGLYFYSPSERFETVRGEQRSVVLRDGSRVTLNTATAIDVRYDKSQRRITLRSGEALFQVTHDARRPFDVIAGKATVRAVGTVFNVDRHAAPLKVTVVEGRVQISAGSQRRSLGAGEQMTLTAQRAPEISAANIASATAWTHRQLIFENQPLSELAAEFNRYNPQVIQIESAELRNERISGTFESNDPETFVEFLRRIPGATVETSADRSHYIVRWSRPP